jgi:hypothetical protein
LISSELTLISGYAVFNLCGKESFPSLSFKFFRISFALYFIFYSMLI